jgi:hypothetical protein
MARQTEDEEEAAEEDEGIVVGLNLTCPNI